MIGTMQMIEVNSGWILLIRESGIQGLEFSDLYITAFYFIITSFSSVGYGDVKGNTFTEYQFQLVVEIIGIGFFGYMTGTF